MRRFIALQFFKLYLWLGNRCYNCQGAGSGINWQDIPMECPKCNGSGLRK
jgi:DnaJ-class molecular chaperone